MKRTLVYLMFCLPFVMMLAGCLKTSNQETTPLPQLNGTYTGKFARLKLNKTTNKYDTLRADVTLTLNISTGFTVGGDTTNVAGSYGDFTYDYYYFQFNDKTYPKTGYPAKPHLAGVYAYGWDGTTLQLQQTYPLDTLGYFYNLTKH